MGKALATARHFIRAAIHGVFNTRLTFNVLYNILFLLTAIANAIWENGSARTTNVPGFVQSGETRTLKLSTLVIMTSKELANTSYPKAHLLVTNRLRFQ